MECAEDHSDEPCVKRVLELISPVNNTHQQNQANNGLSHNRSLYNEIHAVRGTDKIALSASRKRETEKAAVIRANRTPSEK